MGSTSGPEPTTSLRLPGTLAEVQHSPRGPQIGAYFDLDGTLVAGFTAAALAKEQHKRSKPSQIEMIRQLGPVIDFARGKLEFADMLRASTGQMAGMSPEEVDELGQYVFTKKTADLVYPEMRKIVQAHLDRGHTVVLSSSALSLQVEPVAKDLGIEEVLCNRLVVGEDGALTGDVVEPVIWGDGKSAAVQRHAAAHGVDLSKSYFYADGDEDVALMHIIGHPRPTNPKPKMAEVARRRGWPVLEFSSRGAGGLTHMAKQMLGLASMGPLAASGAAVGLASRDKWRGLNVLLSNYPAWLLQLNGVKLHVTGRENLEAARPAIFIFNHRNNSDGIVAAALVGHDYTGVAKKELEKNPFMGPVGKVMETAFLDRGNSVSAVEELKKIEALARKGLSVLIAPEGTRSRATGVGPFKKGAFRMAMAAGIPVVPIIIRNIDDVAGYDSATLNPGTVDVHVGEPIHVGDWKVAELDERIAAVREMYVDRLANWPGREA